MKKRWLILLLLLPFVAGAMPLPSSLTGRVVSEGGAPVPGVSLWAVAGPWNRHQPPASLARSGPDGSFAIPELPAGRFVLYACGEGFLPWMEAFPSAGKAVEVTLEPAAALRGRVLKADGQPLAGASVRIAQSPERWELPGPCPLKTRTSTDDQGRFSLGPLEPDEYSLGVWIEDRWEGGLYWVMAPPGQVADGVTIWLRTPGYQVRVVDANGRPVSGAEVSVVGLDEPPAWKGNLWQAETAANGSAVFVDLPAEQMLLLHVESEGLAFTEWQEGLNLGERRDLEVRLAPAETVPGRVIDEAEQPVADVKPAGERQIPAVLAEKDRKECGPRDLKNVHDPWEGFEKWWAEQPRGEPADPFFLDVPLPARGKVIGPDGAPVSGARITRVEGESTTSAADGSFEISVPAHGWNVITASKEGLAVGWRRVDAGGAPIENLEIQLHPEAMVIGRVLGLAPGEPDSSEELTLQGKEGPVFSARVSADGTFRLPQIPPGTWKLSMNVSGREASTSVLVPPGQTEVRADLQLPLTHPVAGQVLDERGEPLAGAQVLTWFGGRISAEISTETGADGRFTLALPDGEHHLRVRKEGYRWGGLDAEVQGAPVTGLRYQAERTALLRGRLLGLPPGDKVIVEIEAVEKLQSRTPTDIEVRADGYSIPGLSPGLWRLTVRTPSCKLWRTIEIPPGTTAMDMDLDVTPEGPDWGTEP